MHVDRSRTVHSLINPAALNQRRREEDKMGTLMRRRHEGRATACRSGEAVIRLNWGLKAVKSHEEPHGKRSPSSAQ